MGVSKEAEASEASEFLPQPESAAQRTGTAIPDVQWMGNTLPAEPWASPQRRLVASVMALGLGALLVSGACAIATAASQSRPPTAPAKQAVPREPQPLRQADVGRRPQPKPGPRGSLRPLAPSPTAPPMQQEACDYSKVRSCPASEFLRNPEVVESAVESLLRIGLRDNLIKEQERGMVSEVASAGLLKIEMALRRDEPEVASELEHLPITEAQKNAVTNTLRLLSQPQVQLIGLEVARAIRGHATESPEALRRRIEEALLPRRDELRQLRRDVLPVPMQVLWGKSHSWELTLEPENIRDMDSFRDVAKDASSDILSAEAKSATLFGGALEIGRVLLEILRTCLQQQRPESVAPTRGAVWALARGADLPPETQSLASVKAMRRSVRFGIQGLEALRRLDRDERHQMQTSQSMSMRLGMRVDVSDEDTGLCNYAKMHSCPASELLLNVEVREAVVQNLLRLSIRDDLLDGSDMHLVRDITAETLQKVQNELWKRAPEAANTLLTMPFVETQKDAVVRSLLLLSDSRVQIVGLDVANVIREHPGATSKELQKWLQEKLWSSRGYIQELLPEVIPESMRELWAQAPPWHLTLTKQNIREMESFSRTLDNLPKSHNFETKSVAILCGVLEQARVLLAVVEMGLAQAKPERTAALASSVQAMIDTLLSGAPLPADSSGVDYVKAMVWPLMFGSQGLDALSVFAKMQA